MAADRTADRGTASAAVHSRGRESAGRRPTKVGEVLPSPDLAADLAVKLARLDDRLAEIGSVLVAFSGGADSAFLLAAAAGRLGPARVVAATAVSPSLPAEELAAAGRVAREIGVDHVLPTTRELDRDGYRQNSGSRCAFCKTELIDVLVPLATQRGLAAVVTGTNADDAADRFRPGIAAAARAGALTPLLDAGLSKADVRAASRSRGLSTWDKPAAACLASRIAYGIEVTRERLERVEGAERSLRAALQAAGIATRDLRVRDLGDSARVEVDEAVTPALAARPDLLAAVAGWDRVEVDRCGFRSGSMNALLPESPR